MPLSKLRPSFTLTEDRLRELQAVVPEAFADGKINWDTLREALGVTLEDESLEHFGLFWPGKREARRLAAMPSKGTLIPQPGAGVNEDNTHNLFIEGDNLEVLKLLQKSYAGRVKMIYIDPPYNTGNDFVYPDDFSEPLENYLRRTGQVDEAGQLLTTNSRAGGRFHSIWLSMIYPRLFLARQLLSNDGLIFVSIDDIEISHLRLMMNEIFGEENFVAEIIWGKTYGGGSKAKQVVGVHEYVLCYARDKEAVGVIELPPNPDARKYYTGRDDKYEVRGPFRTQPLATTSMDDRPNLRYAIRWNGEDIWPEKQWQWSQERVQKALENDELIISKQSGKWSVRYKQYLYDESGKERGAKPFSVLDGPYTQEGTAEIKELFGDGKVFPFPKPSKLIKQFISYVWQNKDAIILDFFAGSCTTAHTVLEMNEEDDGNRRFVMIQLPEPTDMKSFPTIAKLGKERIRRVVKRIKKDKSGQMKFTSTKDLGFQSVELVKSHFAEWEPFIGKTTSQLELRLQQAETPLTEGWQPENLLTEILLLQGFPLDSSVRSLPEFKANDIQQVTSEFVTHPLYVCLDKKIKSETVSKLKLGSEDIFVCLDSALSDEAKVKLADQCNLKVI